MPAQSRILIAADEPILGELLSFVFSRRSLRVDLAADASPATILATACATRARLALLDVELRRGVPGGLKLVRTLHEHGTRVIVFAPADALTLRGAYAEAHVDAIAARSQPLDDLVALVERVLEGQAVLTPTERNDVIAAASSNVAAGGACVFDRLTAKEKLAVIELVRGSSVQQIAKSSGVSTATVRGRIQAIRSKLGASSQLALVAEAHKAGWPRPRSGRADVPVVAQSALYRSISSA